MVAALIAAALLAPAPDLTVSSVSVPTGATSPGQLRVPTSIANGGTRRSARSRTRYWLSGDAERGQDIRLRSVRVPRVAAGTTWRRTAKLHVPSVAKSGNYHVIACADSGRVVSERREGNNCRISPDTVSVIRRTEPEIPPGPR